MCLRDEVFDDQTSSILPVRNVLPVGLTPNYPVRLEHGERAGKTMQS